MRVVPLRSVPAQKLTVSLGNQACQITVYQKITGLFIDVYINNALVIGGVICLNLNRIVRSEYLGLVGDLLFLDTQGEDDPTYTGLGSRFKLIYLELTDLDALGLSE